MSKQQKPEPETQDEQQDSSQEQPSAEQERPAEELKPAAETQEPPEDPSLFEDEELLAPTAETETAPEHKDVADPEQDAASEDASAEEPKDIAETDPADGIETPPAQEESESGPLPAAEDGGGDGGDDDGEDDEEKEDDEEGSHEPMSFLDHMTELRVRLVRCLIAAGVGFLACYGFHNELFALLMEPLVKVFPPGSSLIYTGLPEAFFTYIKVSMVAGVLLTSPYIFYQLWCFIAPGLYKEEKKYLLPIAFFSGIFFAAGAIFGYSIVFPFAFGFFMEFATETIKPMPSLKEYLSFSLKLLFAFGFTFEMPLFAFFLGKLGIINAAMMRKFRKYAYLCAFVVAAILTPPDIVSQVLMAGPLIVLFEFSIWVVQAFGRKPKHKEEEEEDNDEEDASDAKEEASASE